MSETTRTVTANRIQDGYKDPITNHDPTGFPSHHDTHVPNLAPPGRRSAHRAK
jgi:hypothetical protein